jgi:hypothetical protein
VNRDPNKPDFDADSRFGVTDFDFSALDDPSEPSEPSAPDPYRKGRWDGFRGAFYLLARCPNLKSQRIKIMACNFLLSRGKTPIAFLAKRAGCTPRRMQQVVAEIKAFAKLL